MDSLLLIFKKLLLKKQENTKGRTEKNLGHKIAVEQRDKPLNFESPMEKKKKIFPKTQIVPTGASEKREGMMPHICIT